MSAFSDPYFLLAFVIMPIVVVALGWLAAWAHVRHSSNMTDQRPRLPDIPLWALGVLGMAVAGLAAYTLLDIGERIESERRASTPRLIEECHQRGGSAIVDGARRIYASCVIPPAKSTP